MYNTQHYWAVAFLINYRTRMNKERTPLVIYVPSQRKARKSHGKSRSLLMVTDSHDARYSVMVSWSSKENRNNRANRYQSWSRAADQKIPQKSRNKVPITPFVKARWTPALDPGVFHVSGLEWDSCDRPPHSGIETLNKVRKIKKGGQFRLVGQLDIWPKSC